MRIGVIVAMDKEFARLEGLLGGRHVERHHNKDFVVGFVGENEVILRQCGIGKVNSAIGAAELMGNYHPGLVVSTGVAGGASTAMSVGDVVVGTEYAYHDAYCGSECERGQIDGLPARFTAPKDILNKVGHVKYMANIHQGLIVSGDWFVDSRDKMAQILNGFPTAMAVDMESCSIAQACYMYDTPFIAFRIISDVPLKDKEARQYLDFWNRLADGSFNITKSFLELI